MTKDLDKRQPGAGALMKYHGQVLTEIGAKEVVSTLWPEAAKSDGGKVAIWKAIQICVKYELNPLMKHVFLVPFGQGEKRTWEVLLGIQANRLIAHRVRDFSYLDDTPRLMTEDEQIRILGEVDKINLWAITKLRDNQGYMAQGYGNWPREKDPYGTDKGNSKANMAFIRSERNAFDRLFAGSLPQGVEIADAQYVVDVSEVKLEGLLKVDKETGEIIEIKGKVEPEPDEPAKPVTAAAPDDEHKITATLVANAIKALKQEPAFAKLLHTKYEVNMGGKTLQDALVALSPAELAEVRAEVNSRQEMAK